MINASLDASFVPYYKSYMTFNRDVRLLKNTNSLNMFFIKLKICLRGPLNEMKLFGTIIYKFAFNSK